MDTTTLIIVAIVVLVVILLIAMLARRRRTKSLSPESRQRYAESWNAIRTRFVEDPHGAVTEADGLAMSILRERGVKVDDSRRLPDDLIKARRSARLDKETGATEDLRASMLHYQRIVDQGVGESTRKAVETGRREVAS